VVKGPFYALTLQKSLWADSLAQAFTLAQVEAMEDGFSVLGFEGSYA
jgi:hypothetical protein